uniref:Uncharacterized protein n=1 Tax=viral metagenome TaxID=1070528 RepID=A0A6M3K4M0_9ZZZZ
MSYWLDTRVNNMQSKAERKSKYALIRQFGGTTIQAKRFRDCHWAKIFRLFGLEVKTRKDMWDIKQDKLREVI